MEDGPALRLPFPPWPLVGRTVELARAGGLLGEVRLLTLVGTGGVGKPPRMKYSAVTRQLRAHSATLVRQGGNHEVWRCNCGKHQTAVPRHGDVSSYVIDKIGQQMPWLPKEWWR